MVKAEFEPLVDCDWSIDQWPLMKRIDWPRESPFSGSGHRGRDGVLEVGKSKQRIGEGDR